MSARWRATTCCCTTSAGERIEAALGDHQQNMARQVAKGKIIAQDAVTRRSRASGCAGAGGRRRQADLVIEAATENEEP